MVKRKLVEELISDGARLLRELDRKSFQVESMFWVHLPAEDYWRLVIGSTFVTQHGGAAGYRRLNEVLLSLELAGITLEDISLLDPASSQFQSLYSLACGSPRLAPGPAWLEFEDAIVYRWTGASVSAELDCAVSAKELQEFWEAEREGLRLSLPALLISKEDGRVTLRFHPQHGPQSGVDPSVKTSFAIAVHRPNARPGCEVNWLD
jgi:hypothetical protein